MHYLIWALVALMYLPVFKILYQSRWETIDYTHAYFILPVSLWLVWRMRQQLITLLREKKPNFNNKEINLRTPPSDNTTPRINFPYTPLKSNLFKDTFFMLLFIVGLFLFFFGWQQDYLFISTLSLIPLLFGLTAFLYGAEISKKLSFPIFYLLLLVPPPLGVLDSITLPMRQLVSLATEISLKNLGYPIIRDGLLLSIGGKEIYMGAPCSGFRSLITMISLGLVYVNIITAPSKNKIILLGSVIPLALAGNFIRVVGMCLVTFYFGENAGHTYHEISGFLIFLVLIGGMLAIERLLNRKTSSL
ncbi:MAG: exosortase/archaeosortase family protein [Candidatus Omnitrophica bacterium]|nr:exosortase/archaeosortase family protein [Candidatus Omnitrophota bacterium]